MNWTSTRIWLLTGVPAASPGENRACEKASIAACSKTPRGSARTTSALSRWRLPGAPARQPRRKPGLREGLDRRLLEDASWLGADDVDVVDVALVADQQ